MVEENPPEYQASDHDLVGMIADALRRKFGVDAATVARRQLNDAFEDSANTWADVIERLGA